MPKNKRPNPDLNFTGRWDKLGNPLHEFDFIIYDGLNFMIIYWIESEGKFNVPDTENIRFVKSLAAYYNERVKQN